MDLAIVIPAYNEASTIRAIAQNALRVSPLVIVVDDGSSDATSEALSGLPLVLLRHEKNLGKAAALWNGFNTALDHDVEFVATLDGDGQHLPEDIRRLATAARRHPRHIVIGARMKGRDAAPMARRFANRFADFWISWAAGYPIADSQSGERLYPASLLRAVKVRHDCAAAFTLESEILIRGAQLGYPSVAVPVATIYAAAARPSHFRPVRDIGRIVVMVAKSLLSQGLHPAGLWNSLRRSPTVVDATEPADSLGASKWRQV